MTMTDMTWYIIYDDRLDIYLYDIGLVQNWGQPASCGNFQGMIHHVILGHTEYQLFLSPCLETAGTFLSWDLEKSRRDWWWRGEGGQHLMVPIWNLWLHRWRCYDFFFWRDNSWKKNLLRQNAIVSHRSLSLCSVPTSSPKSREHSMVWCCKCLSGWWFGTFFIFLYIRNNHPNWLVFFRRVETTNQLYFRCQNTRQIQYDLPFGTRKRPKDIWNTGLDGKNDGKISTWGKTAEDIWLVVTGTWISWLPIELGME